jgi:diguanylate cyclase (GGDEF)-like protein
MIFEIKLAFIRELASGYKEARGAFDRLLWAPNDPRAIADLGRFFHKIAGTSASVGLGTLGALAGVCERVTLMVSTGQLVVTEAVINLFSEALIGVGEVIDEHKGASGDIAPRPVVETGATQPGWASDDRVLSKVLVVDDDPFSAGLIDNCLRSAGLISSFSCDPEHALELVFAELPDLIVLDVAMPGLDGFELCRRVRAHPAMQFTPIIFVTRSGDVAQRVRGLEVGGNDYISKPFEPEELVARVRSHLQRLSTLRDMAIRDGLTRCYNHKYFKARLTQEIARSRRYGTSLTLGMLDIDHFKTVNDTYGHPAGDAVLAHISTLVIASVRTTDVVARYGGEEFGLLLIESGGDEAAIITNRLRERVATHRFPLPHVDQTTPVTDLPITVSIGVAQLDKGEDALGLIKRADAALYEAKAAGRNQVRVIAQP